MIPMIEEVVVKRHGWIKKEEFLDLIAVAQTCPGVFAINTSTFIGNKLAGTKGAILTAVSTALPAFLIILLMATVFRMYCDVPIIAAAFMGIRPAVVALIAVPTFSLAKAAGVNKRTIWIPIVSALLIWLYCVNPIIIITISAVLGYLWGKMSEKTKKSIKKC